MSSPPQNTEAHFQRWHEIVSQDSRSTGRMLAAIARHASSRALQRIAEHPDVPEDTLRELAVHPDADVRTAVAENRTCPPDLLLMLAKDENADVRYSLAENHSIPSEVLCALCEDDNPYVAFRAQKTVQRLNQTECEVRTFGSVRRQALGISSVG